MKDPRNDWFASYAIRLVHDYGCVPEDVARFMNDVQSLTVRTIAEETEKAKPLPLEIKLLLDELLKFVPMKSV